eukprot:1160967-Pelagomonas_calceolata.AAC.5
MPASYTAEGEANERACSSNTLNVLCSRGKSKGTSFSSYTLNASYSRGKSKRASLQQQHPQCGQHVRVLAERRRKGVDCEEPGVSQTQKGLPCILQTYLVFMFTNKRRVLPVLDGMLMPANNDVILFVTSITPKNARIVLANMRNHSPDTPSMRY